MGVLTLSLILGLAVNVVLDQSTAQAAPDPRTGLAAPTSPSHSAKERHLRSFSSQVEIQADARILVQERLEFETGQADLSRNFATLFLDDQGRESRVNVRVQAMDLDGMALAWKEEPLARGVRVRPESLPGLTPGTHVLTLSYALDRQIAFFPAFDELYFDATGANWGYTADRVLVEVVLPQGATPLRHTAFTGPARSAGAAGALGRAFTASTPTPGVIRFQSVAPLGPGDGFTVNAAWPKGFVREGGDDPGPDSAKSPGLPVPQAQSESGAVEGQNPALSTQDAGEARPGPDPAAGTTSSAPPLPETILGLVVLLLCALAWKQRQLRRKKAESVPKTALASPSAETAVLTEKPVGGPDANILPSNGGPSASNPTGPIETESAVGTGENAIPEAGTANTTDAQAEQSPASALEQAQPSPPKDVNGRKM